jgi:hypothetical protein
MSDHKSLAAAAVDALAAIDRMDATVTNEHEERHHIRSLKRIADQILADAFRQARELAWLAEDVQRLAQQARDAKDEPA